MKKFNPIVTKVIAMIIIFGSIAIQIMTHFSSGIESSSKNANGEIGLRVKSLLS